MNPLLAAKCQGRRSINTLRHQVAVMIFVKVTCETRKCRIFSIFRAPRKKISQRTLAWRTLATTTATTTMSNDITPQICFTMNRQEYQHDTSGRITAEDEMMNQSPHASPSKPVSQSEALCHTLRIFFCE